MTSSKSMGKKIVVANWKMNPSIYGEAEKLFLDLLPTIKATRKVKVVICPPFVWLTDLSHKYKKSVAFGAQNVFWEAGGAYTGEVSPPMLKSSGVSYVIIGHSERRIYLAETDEMINKKLRAVLEIGLIPILCIGEEGKNSEGVSAVVGEQLEKALAGIRKNLVKKLIVAYEPIWAISATPGAKPDTPDNAFRVSIFIRKILAGLYGRKMAGEIKVIYGGSVNAKNIFSFLQDGKMEGVLVGGASLKPEEFSKIVKIANHS